jgi:hypothetical protein
VQAKYPNVKPVVGGLDDSNIIKEAAAKADIVIRELCPWFWWTKSLHCERLTDHHH